MQKQGQITLEEVEKSIKELPLPEKVKAIAIYKRYREIKKIEEAMDKATREIEKKYLKLDEPVLNNVLSPLQRSPTSSPARDPSTPKNSRTSPNTLMKVRSRNLLTTSPPTKSRGTGPNALQALP